MGDPTVPRNLVVVRAGPNSLHRAWLPADGKAAFDLLVAAYDPAAMAPDRPGVRHVLIPGRKVQGWHALFAAEPELLDGYDAIALLDDDLDARHADIARCFAIGAAERLAIWQPALAWGSYATYGASLRNPLFRLRRVNLVEMMCPFFRADALREVLPLFALGYETAIDLVWCSLIPPERRRFAVIDAATVRHTRPVASASALNGFADRKYEADIDALLRTFRFRWPAWVTTEAVTRGGRHCRGLALGLTSLLPLAAVAWAPNPRYAARATLTHAKHQFSRRADYCPSPHATLRAELAK